MAKTKTAAAVPPADEAFSGELPLQHRLMDVSASSFNAETRELDVTASTGAAVRRRRYADFGVVPYDEELTISASAINMERMNSGAPILDSHSAYGGIIATLGAVKRGWIEGGKFLARIKLHDAGISPVADALAGMIKGGTAPKISLGYRIDKVNIIKASGADTVERWIGALWTPYELSFTPITAEAGTGVRSADEAFPVIFNRATPPILEEKTMTRVMEDQGGDEATRAAEIQAASTLAANKAVDEDRKRGLSIRSLGSTHKLPPAMIDKAIGEGVSLENFRASALDHLAAESEKTVITGASSHLSKDDPVVRNAAMTDAMAARILSFSGKKVEVSDLARGYMDFGLSEMAATVLGDTRKLSASRRDEILTRAFHSTSDFPGILENVANKVLLARYETATPTYRLLAGVSNFSDFKPTNMLRAGDFPNLLKVGETGEIKAGTMSESKEQITLATYARQIRFSRNMLINDDLGAIATMLGTIGARVADFENATFYAVLASNPVMLTDGVAMFHATHGNLAGAGTAITLAALSAARAAMMKQQSLDGIKINLQPKFLITGADKQTEAEQVTWNTQGNLYAAKTTDINTVGTRLTPVADANLTGNTWYLATDPSAASNLVYGHLDGAPGPQLRTDEPFGINGVAMQVVLDFACGQVDYRGMYMNAGA